MAKVVLGKLDKFDLRNTLIDISSIELATDSEENLTAAGNDENELYIPSHLLTPEIQNLAHVQVYFDLENYSFYQKAKDIIEGEAKPKGVFRFRRIINQEKSDSLISEDLYVLSSLLGELEDIQVRQTNSSITPTHVILMINFGGGTMAHMEYTFTQTYQERIEFEWSGVKNIIEFDSESLKPIQPDHQINLVLIYPVDSILNTAHEVDQALIDRLDHFKKLINGGAK